MQRGWAWGLGARLHNACSYGHFEVTKLLIRQALDIRAPTRELGEEYIYEYKVTLCSWMLAKLAIYLESFNPELSTFIHPYSVMLLCMHPAISDRSKTQTGLPNTTFIGCELYITDIYGYFNLKWCKVNALDGFARQLFTQMARGTSRLLGFCIPINIDTTIISLEVITALTKQHLLEAAKAGDLDTVRRICLLDPHSLNCRELGWAIQRLYIFAAGFNRVASGGNFLLEMKLKVDALIGWFSASTQCRASYGHFGGNQLLIKAGANVSFDFVNLRPTMRLPPRVNMNVNCFLNMGADPSKRIGMVPRLQIWDGNSLLLYHLAAGYITSEWLSIYWKNGADVNAQDKGGLNNPYTMPLPHGADPLYGKTKRVKHIHRTGHSDDVKCLLQDAMATSLSSCGLKVLPNNHYSVIIPPPLGACYQQSSNRQFNSQQQAAPQPK
ncbi:Tankyrase [Lucilia cuprina]|nr:Tankyrase [Lucilia cuprina]